MYFVWITATDSLQRYLFERFGLEIILDSGWKSLALTILISLGLSVLYIFTFQLITRSIAFVLFPILEHYNIPHGPSQFPEVLDYLHRANNGLSVAIMISMFYLVVNPRSHQQIKDIQLQTERQGQVAAMSQFEALKNQLSPHFLFNSLSILTSLVLM